MSEPREITIQPLISYPRQAEAGKSYLMTVDVEMVGKDWPYEEEEMALYCLLDTEPLFAHEPIGEPAIVLNRFGGSYGEAMFTLTAQKEIGEGEISVRLLHQGVPVHHQRLDVFISIRQIKRNKRLSWIEIIRRRQLQAFVGRSAYLDFFRQNMRMELGDPDRMFIFNVSGQGGVGKTALLHLFEQMAKDNGRLTTLVDEGQPDPLVVMAHISSQLQRQNAPLKLFEKAYQIYQEETNKLDIDDDALITYQEENSKLDTGDEAAISQIEAWDAYVRNKLKDKETAQLVLHPVESLTPLFVIDLQKVADTSFLVLFFDTYEHTQAELDNWLLALVQGDYGGLPLEMQWVIAGRQPLNSPRWQMFKAVVHSISLEPFTEPECRDYLAQKGVTDETMVTFIMEQTGRLPVLVSMLATVTPDDPNKLGEMNETAVERFLKWVSNPTQRQLALDAALPLTFNRDTVALLTSEDEADSLFAWLKERPFVRETNSGWQYHEVVRPHMLQHKLKQSPNDFIAIHKNLLTNLHHKREAMNVPVSERYDDTSWLEQTLEYLYHILHRDGESYLVKARDGFIEAFIATNMSFCLGWAKIIYMVGQERKMSLLLLLGEALSELVSFYTNGRVEEAIKLVDTVMPIGDISSQAEAMAYTQKAIMRSSIAKYDVALSNLEEAISIQPSYTPAIIQMAIIYQNLHRFVEAAEKYQQALFLDPMNVTVQNNLGNVYRQLGQYEEALEVYNKAKELKPILASPYTNSGHVYHDLLRYEEAIEAYEKAIELNPTDANPYDGLGNVYVDMERYEEAIEAYERAIELDPTFVNSYYGLGNVYQDLGVPEEAIGVYRRAIEVNPNNVYAYNGLGKAYQDLGMSEEAIGIYRQAIELDKTFPEVKIQLGELLLEIQQYIQAEAIYINLLQDARDVANPILEAHAHFGLGLSYRYQQHWVDADRELNLAMQMAGDNEKLVADATFSLGLVAFEQKKWGIAVSHFYNTAILYELLEEIRASADAYYHLGRTFGELEAWEDAINNLQIAQKQLDDVFESNQIADVVLQAHIQQELEEMRIQSGAV